jgi:hypothetical protein
MNLLCRIVRFSCLPVLFVLLATSAHAKDPSQSTSSDAGLKQTAEKAVEVRRESQKLADRWAVEATDLRSEIHALEAELETLKWRREKTAVYMKDLEDKMTGLKSKEEAANEIRNELEPFLDQTLQNLKDFSEKDLPMLTRLQAPTLRFAESTLNSADANMVQKTQRLLEATTRALEYGYFPQLDEAEIDIEGRRIRVQLLNIGRLCLFALSGNGRDAWKWERKSGRYVPVPHFARSIQEVIQITQRTRLVSLVELPVGPPEIPTKEMSR